jgi:DNA topoisomerase-1
MKVPIRENINYKLSELDLLYKLSYSKIIFDGYYKVVEMKEIDSKKEIKIPKFNIGDKFKVKKYNIEDKETQPPSRYNDGSLIKTLDDIKVGRPSTFASIIRILKKRFYVDMENKAMKITDFGNIVYKKLIEGFPKFMNEEYTAMLEKDLNEIAKGKKDYKEMLTIF